MHSPSKNDKLIQEDQLETGSDGIPQEIWDDINKNEKFIYYSLMFLNGSVLWAYYSCLSAQDYYSVKFGPVTDANGTVLEKGTKYNFNFLTTLCTAWPMVFGHFIQIVTGLDKKLGQKPRVFAGYTIFIVCASLIMIFSSIKFSSKDTGAVLVLVMFGCIGFGNSLSEATYYMLAALFPVEKFTNAVQIGNVCAGIFNITVATILRLIVGGVHQTSSSAKLAFYLFFSLLILVLFAAIFLYIKLTNLPCIKFLFERNEKATKEKDLALNPAQNISNLLRVFTIVWVPAIAQFLIFFVSLAVFPGFGCTATRNVLEPFVTKENVQGTTANWYCAPGIIGSYNYGDFFGRIICTAAVYKIFNMKLSFSLAVLRIAYIPIMLMGVAGTSLYIFGSHPEAALAWNIIFNLTIGLSNGLLSTVTMGVAPRLCKPEDRETAGAVMVFFLFLGIAAGAHFGFLVNQNGWLGL